MRQISHQVSGQGSRQVALTAALASALFLFNSGLFAQAPPQQVPPQAPAQEPTTPQRKLNLTVEQRYTIREASTPAPAVGDAIPQDVRPQPMPDAVAQKVPQVKTHKFFIAKDEIVIVDPKDNTVTELIKIENQAGSPR